MKMKKISFFSTLEIVFVSICIAASVAIFILLQRGVFDLNGSGSLSEGLGKAFGILFYALFMIVQGVISLVTIIEGILVKLATKKCKNVNAVVIIVGIIKIFASAFSILIASIEFGVQLWTLGAFASIFAAGMIFTAIFGFICAKEIKAWSRANEIMPYIMHQDNIGCFQLQDSTVSESDNIE